MPDIDDLLIPDETWPDVKARLRQAWLDANPGVDDAAMPSSLKAAEGPSRAPSSRLRHFADPGPPGALWASLWVGLLLDPIAADALADAADSDLSDPLHVTLWFGAGPGTELRWAQTVARLADVAAWRPPLEGRIAGAGRFANGDEDVLFAIPSVPDLDALRSEVATCLEDWCGLPTDSTHGFVPHATLRYVPAGDDTPLPDVPAVGLRFDLLTMTWGERSVSLPIGGAAAAVGDGSSYAERATVAATGGAGAGARVWRPLRLADGERPDAEWVPCLPAPGTYNHPWYGEMDLTAATYERIVANVQAKVYQDALPVNAEHDLPASGAVGWIEDVRLNADGSIDAFVRWNDRGRALLDGDRFRYVSAELRWSWTDPVTDTEYQDVLVGLALCTRPYFKPSVLRPLSLPTDALAASDPLIARGLSQPVSPAGGSDMPDPKGTQQQTPPATGPAIDATPEPPAVVTLSESEVARFREMEREHAAFTARVEAAETKAAKLESDARTKRFADEVMGRSDANGTPWASVGDVDAKTHVEHLEALAAQFGEDSPQINHYLALNRAHAAQAASFVGRGEAGSDAPGGGGGDAWARIEAKAKTYAEQHAVSFAQAVDAVVRQEPALYAEHKAERR